MAHAKKTSGDAGFEAAEMLRPIFDAGADKHGLDMMEAEGVYAMSR
jgi:hypothetical protein